MLYKVVVGRDEYLGAAEEVVAWMAKAVGAPRRGKGGPEAYMRAIRERLKKRGLEAPIDVESPEAFLASLAAVGLASVEERPEASSERADPKAALGDGPVAFGDRVSARDLEDDVLGPLDDA